MPHKRVCQIYVRVAKGADQRVMRLAASFDIADHHQFVLSERLFNILRRRAVFTLGVVAVLCKEGGHCPKCSTSGWVGLKRHCKLGLSKGHSVARKYHLQHGGGAVRIGLLSEVGDHLCKIPKNKPRRDDLQEVSGHTTTARLCAVAGAGRRLGSQGGIGIVIV